MGFDRAEFLDNLKAITGVSTATFPAMRMHFAALEEVAVNAVHVRAKEQEIEDLLKGMRDGGNVLSGGRQRRNGRNEYADLELLNDRYGVVDDILIQNSINTLAELQVLYDHRDQLNSNLRDWRLENLSEEENARIEALPEEEQWDATKELLDQKLAAGEITAAQHAEFMRQYDAYQANEANIAKKEEQLLSQDANLSRDENAAVIAHQLALKRQQLVERRAELDTRLGENLILIDRLNTLRRTGGSREDVVDLVDDRADLDVDIPETASTEQSITLAEQAISTNTAALEVEKAETDSEIDEIERSQETLTVVSPETKIIMDAARYDGEVHEEANNVTTLTGGFSLALNADEPLDGPKEATEQPSTGGEQKSYTVDLGLKTDLTG